MTAPGDAHRHLSTWLARLSRVELAVLTDVVLSKTDDPPDSEDVRELRAFVEDVKAGQPDAFNEIQKNLNV